MAGRSVQCWYPLPPQPCLYCVQNTDRKTLDHSSRSDGLIGNSKLPLGMIVSLYVAHVSFVKEIIDRTWLNRV